MLTTTIALLVAFAGPMQTGPSGSGNQLVLASADSAHTLFVPNAPDAGRSGQIYQLPQGGFGVTTGGTSHYQTLGMPGGNGVAIPNGSTASFLGSGGRAGVLQIPD